jgi:phage internal scaffolding protein
MSFYKKGGIRNAVDCQQAILDGEEIRVEQSHKKKQDINEIVKKHGGNLELIAANSNLQAMEMDEIPTNDFQEMMEMVVKAQQTFESIPSKIRARFNHNPAEYLDFIRNPANQDEMVSMGLATIPEPEPEPVPVQVEVVNPPQN